MYNFCYLIFVNIKNYGIIIFSDGGKYDKGIIVRSYRQGQVIQVDADLTAGHLGHMEFRISALGTRGDKIGKLYGDILETVNNLLILIIDNLRTTWFKSSYLDCHASEVVFNT